jgi:hypothetical protein
VGIISCFTDFVDSGAAKAVCEALPFDVIGITTTASAVPEDYGELMLSVLVISSDTVSFVTGLSSSVAKSQDGPLAEAWNLACGKAASQGVAGRPEMMLVYAPFIQDVGGEAVVESLNRVSGGIPLFGTLAIDSTEDYHSSRIIYNGEIYKEAVAFALMYGNIKSEFFIGSISDEQIQEQWGLITKSKGNLVMEINGKPVTDYLKALGVRTTGGGWDTISFPFIIDYADGTRPVTRSVYIITGEGYASCGGAMPEGASLTIGNLDHTNVLDTTGRALDRLVPRSEGSAFLLMYSCVTRYLVLGINSLREMELVAEKTGGGLPYQFTYSGGEICPVEDDGGLSGKAGLVNRFHNCTFIACLVREG